MTAEAVRVVQAVQAFLVVAAVATVVLLVLRIRPRLKTGKARNLILLTHFQFFITLFSLTEKRAGFRPFFLSAACVCGENVV